MDFGNLGQFFHSSRRMFQGVIAAMYNNFKVYLISALPPFDICYCKPGQAVEQTVKLMNLSKTL